MKGTHLGEFEEIVLLTIAVLYGEAYGVAIKKRLEEETGRNISIGAVHAACNRLQDKGFLMAAFGEKSDRRGGKRKKCYTVTRQGQEALEAARDLRVNLWGQIPRQAFQFS